MSCLFFNCTRNSDLLSLFLKIEYSLLEKRVCIIREKILHTHCLTIILFVRGKTT